MKASILLLMLLFAAVITQAQADSSTIWISTAGGNIYKLNVNTCSSQLYCSTGKQFLDIALTPNGNLWGNTQDSLYQIYSTGNTRTVGKIPHSNGLVGLNDSTLFIDSLQYLLALNTESAKTKMIGNMNFGADGDLAWIGKKLFMVGQGHLTKMILNADYTGILNIVSIAPDTAMYTPGLASAYVNGSGFQLIAFPGDSEIYQVDTMTDDYTEICSIPAAQTAFGATSMIFPPGIKPNSTKTILQDIAQISVYPNPAYNSISVKLDNLSGRKSEVEILLYDLMGNLLDHQPMKVDVNKFNLVHYAQGIYLLVIQYQGQIFYKTKIVKN